MGANGPPNRRRLLTVAGTSLGVALVGCLEPQASATSDELLGEQPSPQALVGNDAYVDALAERIERARFPEPDADLLPELTKARFVTAAARDADDDEFADRIDRHREPVFEPFRRFEAVTTLVDERRRERLEADQLDELVALAGLENESVTIDDEPEAIVDAALDDRGKTFFDYPGPPLHVIEAAASLGREELEDGPDERARTVDADRRPYVRQRATVETVVVGAREVGIEAYDEMADQLAASPSSYSYEQPETYGEVVAFNAALAADAMLEEDGELTTPP